MENINEVKNVESDNNKTNSMSVEENLIFKHKMVKFWLILACIMTIPGIASVIALHFIKDELIKFSMAEIFKTSMVGALIAAGTTVFKIVDILIITREEENEHT